MNQRNYQRELERELARLGEERRGCKLLLHSCCAPCSSYVLEYLSEYFEIFLYYYNPNIFPAEEYEYRAKEQEELLKKMSFRHPVTFLKGVYCHEAFLAVAKGLEQVKEGGARCEKCFRLRLQNAFRKAEELGCAYVTTTLSISPMKNATLLNTLGETLADGAKAKWLQGDFKKKEGYKRSIVLSKQYGLYRQEYCGCEFSERKILS